MRLRQLLLLSVALSLFSFEVASRKSTVEEENEAFFRVRGHRGCCRVCFEAEAVRPQLGKATYGVCLIFPADHHAMLAAFRSMSLQSSLQPQTLISQQLYSNIRHFFFPKPKAFLGWGELQKLCKRVVRSNGITGHEVL